MTRTCLLRSSSSTQCFFPYYLNLVAVNQKISQKIYLPESLTALCILTFRLPTLCYSWVNIRSTTLRIFCKHIPRVWTGAPALSLVFISHCSSTLVLLATLFFTSLPPPPFLQTQSLSKLGIDYTILVSISQTCLHVLQSITPSNFCKICGLIFNKEMGILCIFYILKVYH